MGVVSNKNHRMEFGVQDINDNVPVFADGSTVTAGPVSEDADGRLYTFLATDSDATAVFSIVTFRLIRGAGFSVDESNGELRANTAAALDFDSPQGSTREIVVSAIDGAGRNSLQTLTLEISDVNDNAPTFDSPSRSQLVCAR